MRSESFKKGMILNSASVILNAIGPLFYKFAMENLSSLEAAFWGSLITVFLGIIWKIFKPFELSLHFVKKIWPIMVLNTIGTVLLYGSLSYLSPVTFGFVGRVYVVFTTILSIFLLKETLRSSDWCFVLCAILGVFLFASKEGATDGQSLGIAMAIGYTFLFALSNTLVKDKVKHINPMTLLFYNNLSTTLTLGVYLIFWKNLSLVGISLKSSLYLLLGSTFTFAALSTLFIGFKYLSFRLSNLVRASSPVVATIISFPFFPIKVSITNALGGIILIGSIVFLGLSERKSVKK